jgi:hypothetical protein
MFGALFEGMERYVSTLQQIGFTWPYQAIEDRVSYHRIMVEIVARTLEAAGRLPRVGGAVSAFAFNRNGMQVDLRLPRGPENFCQEGGTMSFLG